MRDPANEAVRLFLSSCELLRTHRRRKLEVDKKNLLSLLLFYILHCTTEHSRLKRTKWVATVLYVSVVNEKNGNEKNALHWKQIEREGEIRKGGLPTILSLIPRVLLVSCYDSSTTTITTEEATPSDFFL